MRNILVSVIGLAPQVLTETLYHLTQLQSPPTDISEIYVLTTTLGKERVLETLLDRHSGKYYDFLHDYDIDPATIKFDAEQLIVFQDADGNELHDIRTDSDNEAVADQLLAFVREKTSDPSCRLHCSLAGGRKTMGLYLGLALQLYGRAGDTLSHVLIHPPELEKDRDFFYPSPDGHLIQLKACPRAKRRNGTVLRSDQIRVELAEIPVLLLRGKIALLQEDTDLGYSELVRRTQKEFERLHSPLPLVIKPASRSIRIGEISIHLTPLEFALYLFLARRRIENCDNPDCPGCDDCFFSPREFYDDAMLDQLRSIVRAIGVKDSRCQSLSGWKDSVRRFREIRSKINGKIAKATHGMLWLEFYTITKLPTSEWGETRYGIRLDKHRIKIG